MRTRFKSHVLSSWIVWRLPSRLQWLFTRLLLLFALGSCSICWQPQPAVAGHVVTVRIFVDEEEATSENVWQRRLTQRVENAAEIISHYSPVRFAVVGFGRWSSDNRIQDFSRTLREFEQEVRPDARLAIGFSSQYRFQQGRNHLGGTRGPLKHHVLIRENARNIREDELLEVLVHELGHFLGAAHSSSPRSAMRPVVGDGRARATAFKIGFDPDNARVIRLVGRELADRRIERYEQMFPLTLTRLRTSYSALEKQLPKDPAAKRYLKVVDALLELHQQAQGGPLFTTPSTD